MGKRPRFFRWLALLGVAASALAASHGSAQQQVDARTVAARVQTFYDQTRTFEAAFHQTYFNRLYGRYERSSGQLAFEKPGRMRFDYARPNGKIIVSNGDRLTMWEPGDEGGPGQYVQSATDGSALPSAFSFLTGTGRLETDFRFRLLSSRAWGFAGHVLELTPRRPDPNTRRIVLFVDADPARLGAVHRVRIDDHEGNRNKFEVSSMHFNRPIVESRFAFVPPAGARRL